MYTRGHSGDSFLGSSGAVNSGLPLKSYIFLIIISQVEPLFVTINHHINSEPFSLGPLGLAKVVFLTSGIPMLIDVVSVSCAKLVVLYKLKDTI